MIRQDRTRSTTRAIREARRIGKVLTPALTAELGVQVAEAFRGTQEKVGVESGALKATGRSGHELRDDDQTFVGWVAYGDGTPPVDYAIYHLAVNGPWFSGITATEALMEETINAHIRGHML